MACRMLPVPPVVTTPAGVVSVTALAVEHVERHGDDLGLELRRARAHVALQRVDVGEASERLGHERRSARGRRSTSSPSTCPVSQKASSSAAIVGQLGEDLLARPAVFGQHPVDGEPTVVGVGAHVTAR